MNAFISTCLLDETENREIKVSISRPVASGSNPDWSVDVSSNPAVSVLDQKIWGASEFQCVELAVKYIRKIVESNPSLSVHPDFGSLNTELPETLPYSLGDEFYAEVSAKVAEMMEAKHAELTKRRLAKYPE
jgi:hypothetical protein